MSEKQNVEIKPKCPHCGSTDTRKQGWKLLSGGKRFQQYQCKVCGRVFRER